MSQSESLPPQLVAWREAEVAELTWLEEVGHWPMIEQADQWTEAALAFLDRHR